MTKMIRIPANTFKSRSWRNRQDDYTHRDIDYRHGEPHCRFYGRDLRVDVVVVPHTVGCPRYVARRCDTCDSGGQS